ncbi:RNA-directed DNA polymerase, eukaryota, partial [Tanacetum coccineum]
IRRGFRFRVTLRLIVSLDPVDHRSFNNVGFRGLISDWFCFSFFFFMGDRRSKVDDVLNISTSFFVANFPEQTTAKELWRLCKQYGNVIDADVEQGCHSFNSNANVKLVSDASFKKVGSGRGVNEPSRAEYCQARARLEY